MVSPTVAPPAPSASDPAPVDARRAERAAARHWLWDHSRARRPARAGGEGGPARHRLCGRVPRANGDGVQLRVSTGDDGTERAGWGGVQSCGSVWSCPWCSAKIAHGRQSEISTALTRHLEAGGRIAFATYTMRHHVGQSLAQLWDAGVKAGWRAITNHRAYRAAEGVLGTPTTTTVASGRAKGQTRTRPRIHFIRAVEVTVGPNGWHLHLHVLFLLGPQTSGADGQDWSNLHGPDVYDDALSGFFAGTWWRWQAALVKAGLQAPRLPYGFDVREVRGHDAAQALGDYFTKAQYSDGAALEVARGDLKSGRGGNRPPMQLLRDLVSTYRDGEMPDSATAADDDLWAEWEAASHGRRQITWSRGLRDLLGMGQEATDEELADDDSTAGDAVLAVSTRAYAMICGAKQDHALLVLWMSDRGQARRQIADFEACADLDALVVGHARTTNRERIRRL